MYPERIKQEPLGSVLLSLSQALGLVLSIGAAMSLLHTRRPPAHKHQPMQVDPLRWGLWLAFQCLTIALTGGALVLLLLFYRHATIHSLVPAHAFLATMIIQWAVLPSVGFAVLDFLYGVFTGRSVKAPPMKAIAYAERLLQSRRHMAVICLVTGVIGLLAAWRMLATPPTFESRFLESALRGASDDYAQARGLAAEATGIKSTDVSEGYTQALNVLSRRCHIEYEGENLSQAEIRPLMLSLETAQSRRWRKHPLRWYALGEAYSLYARQARHLVHEYQLTAEASIEYFAAKSSDCFDQVCNSRSRLASPEFKRTALREKGSMLCRIGKHEQALATWRDANREKNVGAWGDVILGLAQVNRPVEAIQEGQEAIKWARENAQDIKDPSSCSAIYVNTALAQWMVGEPDAALRNCLEAVVIQDDFLNRLNFAHALIRAKHHREAQQYLASFLLIFEWIK